MTCQLMVANPGEEPPPKGITDLIELMNTPVEVASKRPQSLRETPGAVTVLTREEILASGARDLLDALQLVPGFQAVAGNFGFVGAGMRGLSAIDGKCLVLVDGQEMNETATGTFALGNHLSVDQISRIEVIRGPGSAIYGGFAALAVVNVITRSGSQLQGVSASSHLGLTAQGSATRDYSAAFGRDWGDLAFSVAYSGGVALRGQDFTRSLNLVDGTVHDVDMEQNSRLRQGFLNVGVQWHSVSFRFIRDLYHFDSLVTPDPMKDHGTYGELDYTWHPTPSLALVPRLSFKEQSAWDAPNNPNQGRRYQRTLGGLQISYSPVPSFNLLAGLEGWRDVGITNPAISPWVQTDDSRVRFHSEALFLQGSWLVSDANITVGGRYDRHSLAGGSFVPRIALTRAWANQHIKLLAAGAFRAPSFWNFDTNPNIKPEHLRTLEAEYGLQVSDHVYVTFNAFDIRIQQFIYYVPASTSASIMHLNGGTVGTQGMEMDLRFQGAWGEYRLTVESHRASLRGVADVEVPGESNYLIGMANLKVTMRSNLNISPHWSFTPSLMVLGPRFTYESTGGPVRRDSSALIDLILNGEWPTLGLKTNLGVRNLMDARPGYSAALAHSGSDTLPNLGREFFLRFGYNF